MLNIVHKNRKIEAEYVSMDELYQAYRDCLKRKISTINALDFEIDDYIFIPNIAKSVREKNDDIKAYVVNKDMKELTFHLGDLTDHEREIILKGCLINYNRG